MRILVLASLVVAVGCSSTGSDGSSSGASGLTGPAGIYDEDVGCMLWSGGDYCDGQQYSNIMVCASEPAEDCVESPSPTPSPNNTVYCCEPPCHRGGESSDGYCKDGRDSYICYEDFIPAFVEEHDCELSSQNHIICC